MLLRIGERCEKLFVYVLELWRCSQPGSGSGSDSGPSPSPGSTTVSEQDMNWRGLILINEKYELLRHGSIGSAYRVTSESTCTRERAGDEGRQRRGELGRGERERGRERSDDRRLDGKNQLHTRYLGLGATARHRHPYAVASYRRTASCNTQQLPRMRRSHARSGVTAASRLVSDYYLIYFGTYLLLCA